MSVRPFAIEVPDAVLEDLSARLQHTRWPEPLVDDAGWDYGADLPYLRELCAYWADGYDWRAAESWLNELPGFLCEVDGVDLHFWHVPSSGSGLPLVLSHGWPGSILEFRRVVEPLVAAGHDVVVPALPGFGFGGKPRDRGWSAPRIARAFHTLMTRELGYDRYGAQGGDWGSMVSTNLGAQFPDAVAGVHLNYTAVPPPQDPSEEDRAAIAELRAWRSGEDAYARLQASKPDALTVGHADSPAALAAWVVEKFRRWGDSDGEGGGAFDRDTLLTNLMFYWAPNSAPSAARIYYESARDPATRPPGVRCDVPTAVAVFPREILRPPRHWVEPFFRIERWTEMERGGHFAALEAPELLVEDVLAFFDGRR